MKIFEKCIRLICIIFFPLLIDGIAMILFDAMPVRDFFAELLVGEHWFFEARNTLGYKLGGLFSVSLFALICHLSCSETKTTQIPTLNLDRISPEDSEWIDEIKQRHKHKEKIIACSSDGAGAARRKARNLGIEACFIDFISLEERDSIRNKRIDG